MALANLDPLVATVNKAIGVIPSATALIKGYKDREAKAIQDALNNGATEAQLAPLIALNDALGTGAQDLADAVAANP